MWFHATDADSHDRFLKAVTPGAIEALRRRHSVAVLYTHHATFVEGPERTIRQEIRATFVKIASYGDGWFPPAREVLDRYRLLEGVELRVENGEISILNNSSGAIPGLTLWNDARSEPPWDAQGRWVLDLGPHERRVLP